VSTLPFRTRAGLTLQREVGRFSSIFWIPSIVFTLRVLMRYRVKNVVELRKRYRALIKQSDGPVLICANHLTMVDSAILAWALGGSWWYVFHYRRMPWNLPEQNNFASTWISQFAAWVTKCLPVVRDGPRQQVSRVIKRVQYLLSRGDTALIFTEGGRSRTGRVQVDAATHGTGRIMSAVEDCRTLCVYLRGDRQRTWSNVPALGDSFHVDIELFQPESSHRGMRRSRDLGQQIVAKLAQMEEKYFASR
jgi:1-acyl-sn-glycerol-3-phosphate acyltransferase